MLEDRRARARVRTRNPWPAAFALLLLGLVVACSSSRRTTPFVGRSGPPVLGPDDDLPGLVLTIHEVTGGTGPNGAFRVGDVLSVRYSVALGDGTLLDIKHLARGAVMVSGPTFNYQRVIASQGDLVARSVSNPDGSYTYKFNTGLPETYLPPINDSPALTDGELTGQPLLSGTYTVGMEVRVDYVIDRETFRDTANATADFLFGSATTIERRDVVRTENCNQCHQELRAHGGNRTRVEICLLCHTAGAEDL
ncbi:MAG TPA: hypothetical protein VK081_08065, partial [Planctomycetota bacterium]|nr:hypothetical protein [Planctomycetota bacterium]